MPARCSTFCLLAALPVTVLLKWKDANCIGAISVGQNRPNRPVQYTSHLLRGFPPCVSSLVLVLSTDLVLSHERMVQNKTIPSPSLRGRTMGGQCGVSTVHPPGWKGCAQPQPQKALLSPSYGIKFWLGSSHVVGFVSIVIRVSAASLIWSSLIYRPG